MPKNPFKKAIKKLDQHGWGKGSVLNHQSGAVCIIGALSLAEHGEKGAFLHSGNNKWMKDPSSPLLHIVDQVAHEVDRTVDRAWQYNDWRAHSADDVKAVLNKAAERWKAEQHEQ